MMFNTKRSKQFHMSKRDTVTIGNRILLQNVMIVMEGATYVSKTKSRGQS